MLIATQSYSLTGLCTISVNVSDFDDCFHKWHYSHVQVLNNGRRNRINIPQSCWSKMSDTFSSYAKDLPMPSGEEESTASGSDDN